jgi:hypothetical protein
MKHMSTGGLAVSRIGLGAMSSTEIQRPSRSAPTSERAEQPVVGDTYQTGDRAQDNGS